MAKPTRDPRDVDVRRATLVVAPSRIAAVAVVAFLLVAVLALRNDSADAHHADVDVTCLAAPGTIRVTATAWDAPTSEGRANNAIVISYDGTDVATGVFTQENGYAFTIDFEAPDATGTHIVRATAEAGWGTGGTILETGEYREATIELPCGPAESTTTTTSTTTSTTSPPTVAPPAPTTTVLPTEVLDTTVNRAPDVAVPIEALPKFAG